MAGKEFSISTVFKVIDRISAPLMAAARSTKVFKAAFKRDMRAAQLAVTQLGASIKSKLVGGLKMAALAATGALAIGLATVTKDFVKLDDALTSASAKFSDMKPENYAQNLAKLGAVARKVGADTQYNAVQAAEGLDFLAMAGFKSEQAMVALPRVVDLATAANIDLARAVDISSDSLGAFGLMAEDTTQLVKNMDRINNVFAKTVTTSNTDLNMLFESVKKGGSTFKATGQSLETFAAITGTLANSGIKASESGTALRNIMLRLADTSPKAKAQLQNMGITLQDSKGNFKDALDILGQFEKATAKMGTRQKAAALSIIFGKRAINSVNTIMSVGVDKVRKYREELKDSDGAAKQMADTMRKSLGNQLKILGSTLTEMGFKFIEGFKRDGVGGIQAFTEAVREFDPKPLAKSLRTIASTTYDLWKFIKPIAPTILVLVATFKAYKAALMVVAAAQMAFNAVAAANPIGLITIGIFGLIAAITLLVIHWDKITAKMREMPAVTAVFTVLSGGMFGIIETIRIFTKEFDNLLNKDIAFFEDIDNFFRSIDKSIDKVTQRLGDFAKQAINSGAEFLKGFEPIAPFVDSLSTNLNGFVDAFTLGLNKVSKGFVDVSTAILKAITPLSAFVDMGRSLTDFLVGRRNEQMGEKEAIEAESGQGGIFGLQSTTEGAVATSIQQSITEKITRSFLTITDESGKAQLQTPAGSGISLKPSGAS